MMETALFGSPSASAAYHHSSYTDGFNFDTSFQWTDEGIVDSILSFEDENFFPDDLFNSSPSLDPDSVKDLNRMIDEWRHQLQNSTHFGTELKTLSPDNTLHGCNEMRTVADNFSKLDFNGEQGAQLHINGHDNNEVHDDDHLFGAQLSNIDLNSVIEGLDLTSLLEQFEAIEANGGHVSSEGKVDALPISAIGHVPAIQPEATFPLAVPSDTQENDKSPGIPNGGKHNLPVGKLPRFSIILKRDPVACVQEAFNALRDHDYCTTGDPPSSVKDVAADNSSREMKNVLKPVSAKTLQTPAVEPLYSKLPDYYTSIVPQICTRDENSNKVILPKMDTKEDCEESAMGQVYYDKLPQYLTSFVNTTISKLPKNSEVVANEKCNTQQASGTGLLKNDVQKGKGSHCQSRKRPSQKNHVRKSYCSERTEVKRCCKSSKSKGCEKKICDRNSRANRNCPRRPTAVSLQNARYMSSRSPSVLRPQSRSRSRSRGRASSVTSCTSSSSSSSSFSPRHTSPFQNEQSKPKCQRDVRYSSCYKYKANRKGNQKREQEKRVADEKKKQIEDRRVVHVGNIKPGTTKLELRRRFGVFGPIEYITIHHRKNRDSFGFITFIYTTDAFEALEHGNDEGFSPKYELSLGGRRIFCLDHYSDLDSTNDRNDSQSNSIVKSAKDIVDFDDLLKAAKNKTGRTECAER